MCVCRGVCVSWALNIVWITYPKQFAVNESTMVAAPEFELITLKQIHFREKNATHSNFPTLNKLLVRAR